MSFEDCVQRAILAGEIDGIRGEQAKRDWREKFDRYRAEGRTEYTAMTLAANDVKAEMKRQAALKRHVTLAKMANNAKIESEVLEAARKGTLDRHLIDSVDRVEYETRSLMRRFNGILGEFLRQHHRDLLGRVTKPAGMRNIVRELHGEASGDEAAKALADGIRAALEDMRLMNNEAGGIIGKLENWGLPHRHNKRAITVAGFDQWSGDIRERIDWTKIENHRTGRAFQEGSEPPPLDVQNAFLREVYDNIAYGKGTREATYGKPQGSALYAQQAEHRVLHFKGADAWMEYNAKYGTGDPFTSLMAHVHGMARDIVAMRSFGPNPTLGVDYMKQVALKAAREARDDANFGKVESAANRALRMFRVIRGGAQPETLAQDYTAAFLSTARHVMTSAFLDRAIVASISDTNSMRLAAQAVGMNPANVLSRHTKLMANAMDRDDALRAGWIADTMADPGAALARFQSEVMPLEFAQKLSDASMRAQGLSGWTDYGKIAFQMEMSGFMAKYAGKGLDEVDEPLRGFLKRAGLTDDEWRKFTDPEALFKAGNGATFASPFWWRESTTLPKAEADRIFFKVQSMIEEQTEFAVPTRSVRGLGSLDPAAFGLPPGSLPYEVLKSGLMFKSFAITFTVNQFRRIRDQPTVGGKIGYGLNLAAGATIMGGISLQLGELIKGNDPMPMDNPDFFARAAAKGGGFGIIGDIVSTGQSSWGGGFPSYVAGPVPQAIGDVYDLTLKNAVDFAYGEDTNFARDLARFGKRYTPMGQTPLLGPSLDRMFWDQLQLFLDPESASAIQRASRLRENRDGNGEWWPGGSAFPERVPALP